MPKKDVVEELMARMLHPEQESADTQAMEAASKEAQKVARQLIDAADADRFRGVVSLARSNAGGQNVGGFGDLRLQAADDCSGTTCTFGCASGCVVGCAATLGAATAIAALGGTAGGSGTSIVLT